MNDYWHFKHLAFLIIYYFSQWAICWHGRNMGIWRYGRHFQKINPDIDFTNKAVIHSDDVQCKKYLWRWQWYTNNHKKIEMNKCTVFGTNFVYSFLGNWNITLFSHFGFLHNAILHKTLNLWLWNFEPLFLRMYFLSVAPFFLKLWSSVWVDICILNMFHEVLTLII